ncbi:hypothetical protein RP20_CCG007171 [Aedes albopictus]|nr:hypothetical protein RP20_CCG007171 [Aedes albopictus]
MLITYRIFIIATSRPAHPVEDSPTPEIFPAKMLLYFPPPSQENRASAAAAAQRFERTDVCRSPTYLHIHACSTEHICAHVAHVGDGFKFGKEHPSTEKGVQSSIFARFFRVVWESRNGTTM